MITEKAARVVVRDSVRECVIALRSGFMNGVVRQKSRALGKLEAFRDLGLISPEVYQDGVRWVEAEAVGRHFPKEQERRTAAVEECWNFDRHFQD